MSDREPKGKVTTADIASWEGVSPRTVRRWIAEGKLSGRKTIGGTFRIKRADYKRARKAVDGDDGADEP